MADLVNYENDLYGDLDLEDLDASQLEEELVEPPELETRETEQETKRLDARDAPLADEGAPGQTGLDRIRPSDMPDEGLVYVPSPAQYDAIRHRKLAKQRVLL
ncbi:hypothetical protein P7C73_g5018, partial [Tremellales sp. Uapishka_1]